MSHGSGPPRPFARFEWQIVWRFLLARRSEGGISVMSIISTAGIAIAVFALVATLAVRSGYRTKFVDTIVGANAHLTVFAPVTVNERGQRRNEIDDHGRLVETIQTLPGVFSVMPQVHAQVIGASDLANAGVDLYGLSIEDIAAIPLVGKPVYADGSIEDLREGIAIGSGLARQLALGPGDEIRLVSPNGARTFLGATPRISSYRVAYIFSAGRYDIDNTRAYLPLDAAQRFLNHEGTVDEIAVFIEDPEQVGLLAAELYRVTGGRYRVWTWQDASGAFLQALQMEDNLMFIVMSILVLVATSNIVSGLVMLIKNKTATIGILRSMGMTRWTILRIFFLFGAVTGLAGTLVGTVAGCLFAIYIDPIFDVVNWIAGGQVWDPEVRLLARLPAEIRLQDIIAAVTLSLVMSFAASLIPARRAALLPPGSAIRYE